MMKNTAYTKDTKRFWQAREKARSALDKKRANASFSSKVKIAAKLRSDAAFLKSGKIVTSKP
jgi:hypothetical protein